MYMNYLKIAWRNLKGSKLFSVINILGLSIGIAVTIVLLLYIHAELSFDKMYTNQDRIHRVLLHTEDGVAKEIWTGIPSALSPALQNEIPEIEYASRLLKHDYGGNAAIIKANQKHFSEQKLYWADAALFKIFDIEFIVGQSTTILNDPNTVVLSESTAQKYFGNDNPLGKLITLNNSEQLEVKGVFKDFPSNSSLSCDIIVSFTSLQYHLNPSWGNASFETYCLLKPNTFVDDIQQSIQQIVDKNIPKDEQWYSFTLQPLERVHLYSASYKDNYSSKIGDINEIQNLSFLAILILLIACINYMNLITAHSQKKAKDIGVNKTLGATSRTLIFRFYVETALLTCIAMIIGIVFTIVMLPFFNTVFQSTLDIAMLGNVYFIFGMIVIWLIVTLIAGSYPAIFLSKASTGMMLKPSFRMGKNTILVRKGLVILQFAASAVLIVSVIIMHKQLQFMQNKELGFDPENVVAIPITAIQTPQKQHTLVKAFESLATISHVTKAQGFPSVDVSGNSLSRTQDFATYIDIRSNAVDPNFVDVLKLNMLEGKRLSENKQDADTIKEMVLNAKAVKQLGYDIKEVVGKKVYMNNRIFYVVGVVNDFNFSSLHIPIGAYAFHNGTRESKRYLLVRTTGSNVSSSIQQLEATFKKIAPDAIFEFEFLNKRLQNLYTYEQKIAQIYVMFCGLAILIACLGLFGLAAFTAEQRTKEIGIRKVLGASVTRITQMLSLDFVKLVLIAIIIAFPIAILIMNNWLEKFAYKTDIGLHVFLSAGFMILTIALITISSHAIKAAMQNPVKSLKTE
ncbi:FtsX-like permease family protein [Aquimarina algicola]|uniref:FtsX-like permease family protein n=2 Tax=Aquimarina algicola TaxID=2589995 RepID=A0A504JMM2_9FLAO|nr:FtsX-like permease family protein [Aquimarina algicola]